MIRTWPRHVLGRGWQSWFLLQCTSEVSLHQIVPTYPVIVEVYTLLSIDKVYTFRIIMSLVWECPWSRIWSSPTPWSSWGRGPPPGRPGSATASEPRTTTNRRRTSAARTGAYTESEGKRRECANRSRQCSSPRIQKHVCEHCFVFQRYYFLADTTNFMVKLIVLQLFQGPPLRQWNQNCPIIPRIKCAF